MNWGRAQGLGLAAAVMDRGTRIVMNIIIIAKTELRLQNIVHTITVRDVEGLLLGELPCITAIIAEWADTTACEECVEASEDQASTHSVDQNITDTGTAAKTTITNITKELRPTFIGDHTSECITDTITLEDIPKEGAVLLNAGIQST
jgi:hypothetical protein